MAEVAMVPIAKKENGTAPAAETVSAEELDDAKRPEQHVNGNPFGHLSPDLSLQLLSIAFGLFLSFFVIWGASLFWSAGLPSPMSGLLPAAKAAGRGMTFTLTILYFTTLRTTQTALRRLLSDNHRLTDWLVGAIPFHELMPRIHAFLGVVAFILGTVHTFCHAADYIIFWGTVWWPKTWYFSVGFEGNRGTVWLLITGSLLYSAFTLFIMVPGIPFYYFRGLPRPAKDAAATLKTRFLNLAPKLVPSHLTFINLHTAGFLFFTFLISIHAQNQGVSSVAVVFWILGLWAIIDLALRYLPASDAKGLVPIEPTQAYFDEAGKPTGVLLSLPRPPSFSFEAGQYVLIRTSYFSKTSDRWHDFWEGREAHPFSIASPATDKDRISFIIGKAEGWTQRLFEAVADEAHVGVKGSQPLPQLKFTLSRPQGAPAQDHHTFESVLLVGTGVGCTAMMSVFANLVTEENAPKKRPSVKKSDTGNLTMGSARSYSSARSAILDKRCGVPAWTVGVTATLIAFTVQLTAALLVTLVSIADVKTEQSALAILIVDVILCSIVAVITILRVLWFVTVLLSPSAWRHSRSDIGLLLLLDFSIFTLAILQIIFDALGIADLYTENEIAPWAFTAIAICGFISTALAVGRIWVYLHLHSPHGHGEDPPGTVRMVLSSSAHMDALDALLGDILSVDSARARTEDLDGPIRTKMDWGAVLKVSGTGAGAKAPFDTTTFLEPGVQHHAGARFVDADFKTMIRQLMDKMHADHAMVDRAVFLGIFYCGNQASVRQALINGLEEVQREHFDGSGDREPCEKCFGRVMIETF